MTSVDACKNFAETVGPLISIKDITSSAISDSQMCYDDSQMPTQAGGVFVLYAVQQRAAI